MRIKYLVFLTLLILLASPFIIMRYLWSAEPIKTINAVIIDKTVLENGKEEHQSFIWILNHLKYYKKDQNKFDAAKDYYGFFPIKTGEKYIVNDLYGMDTTQLDSIAQACDLTYYIDTYGIYESDWKEKLAYTKHYNRNIYGGLDKYDLYLLKQVINKKKLLIGEFNLFAEPTKQSIREEAEKALNIQWTGWTLRYFNSLDTTENKELPAWVPQLYIAQYKKWPFRHRGGIVFVHTQGNICILEENTEMYKYMPEIIPNKKYQKDYQLPDQADYPFWIDIIESNDSINSTLAYFSIPANAIGEKKLQKCGIPKKFPAVISNTKTAKYYYFSGDYCDNQISTHGAKYKGIHQFNRFTNDKIDKTNRKPFFWKFYFPLMKNILEKHL